MNNEEKISEAIKTILLSIGEDLNRPGLIDTPDRCARAWKEMTRGNKDFPDDIKTFPSEFSDIIFRPQIPFSSLCEHHLLPYLGTIDFAYIPNGRVIGISKIIRIFRHYTAKLSIQEDLTQSLIEKFNELVKPKGSAIRMSAMHTCESTRGVIQTVAPMVTFSFSGCFKDDKTITDQFLQLLETIK